MKKFSRALSLDISGSSTGWSFFSNNSSKIEFGTITTKSKDCLAKRLTVFRNSLLKVLEKYNPEVVIMEDTFVGRNIKVNKILSKFGGVAEQLSYEVLKNQPIIINNKTVKAFFCVKSKEDLFVIIKDLCKWRGKSFNKYNDVSDAIAQLWYYLQKEGVLDIKKETDYGFIYKR